MDEWPNFPEDYLNTRKHEIHVHLQILKREIDEIHEHLVHYQEPWISEGQLRKAIITWKKEDPASWRTVEELDTHNMIKAMKSPGIKPDHTGFSVVQTVQTANDDHHMQKTLRKRHIGLGRTMSSSVNKNQQNQSSSVPRTLSLKKSVRQSISDPAADFKASISPDVIKSQFAKQDFAHKTHYKSPDILSPRLKRSNTDLNSKPSSKFSQNNEKNSGHSRSNTEQNFTTKTTFAPSSTVNPGHQISSLIKNQFASMSVHYKEPGMLSPPLSRGTSRSASPSNEANWRPPIKSSHSPKFSFDNANPENIRHRHEDYGQDIPESPVLPPPSPPYRESHRESRGVSRSNTTSSNTYNGNEGNTVPVRSNTLAHKPSYDRVGGGLPRLPEQLPFEKDENARPVLTRKPSIATILPGPDGRYRAENTSPESPNRRADNFPIRSSSLARRPLGSRSPSAPINPNHSRLPPVLTKKANAKFAPQDSHLYLDNLESPEYGQWDVRSQYSQSQYSQYPSQMRGGMAPSNSGLGEYPAPPRIPSNYKTTTNSTMTSSSVPLAMYPPTPDPTTMPNFAQHSANPQGLADYLRNQSSEPPPEYKDTRNPYSPVRDEYSELVHQGSQFDDSETRRKAEDRYQDDRDRHQRIQSSSSTTSSQRAARRITVWDGANGFIDPSSMPVIEETPGEWERDRERDRKMSQEKNFDFSSFLTDLTRV